MVVSNTVITQDPYVPTLTEAYIHKPVSYTHLDVYKRQDEIILEEKKERTKNKELKLPCGP